MELLYNKNKPDVVDVNMYGQWDSVTGNAVGELVYSYTDGRVEKEQKDADILIIDAEVTEKLNNL